MCLGTGSESLVVIVIVQRDSTETTELERELSDILKDQVTVVRMCFRHSF